MEKESINLGPDCILTIRNAIFSYSLSHEYFTVGAIADLTGYSTTTVAKYINSMKEQGSFVAVSVDGGHKKGRKSVAYTIKFNPHYFIGVDVLPSGLVFGLMNMNGMMVRTDTFKDTSIILDDSFPEAACKAVTEYIDSLPDLKADNIYGICFNIRGAVAFNAAERITEILGIPSSVGSSTNAMAYCEYKTLNPKDSNVLYVNFSRGLGLGIIINRKLYQGRHRTAGEIGHMSLYDNNVMCHCGKQGCLETESSVSAILRKVSEKIISGCASILSNAVNSGKVITADDLVDALRQGDPLCMNLTSYAAQELGKHLAGIAGILDPDSIIIASPLTASPDYCFMDIVKLSFKRYSPRFLNQEVSITKSQIGEDAAIVGACLIARESLSIEHSAESMPNLEKTMKIPFIENLEELQEIQVESALVRNMSGAAIDVVNWPHLYPYAPQCQVRLGRSHSHLAISFSVSGMDLRATEMEDNGRLWEDSCCEFFISPGGATYYQVEISCIGAVRIGKGTGRYDFKPLDLNDVIKVKRWSSLEKKRYDLEGENYRWTVTAIIPFSIIGMDPKKLPDEVRANFCKCGERTAHPHFTTWSPISSETPDFYRPECFGRLLMK